MSGRLSFITQNPVTAGMDEANARRERRERQEVDRATDEAIRRGLQRSLGPAPSPGAAPANPTAGVPVTQSSVTNEAAPGSLPPPVPAQGGAAPQPGGGGMAQGPRARGGAGLLEPVMQELAQVRGGGRVALGVAQQVSQTENRQLERDERLAMLALSRGDLATFRFFGSRAGINLPDEVLNNADQRRLISEGSLMAIRMYPRDTARQQRFIDTYWRSNGDLAAARNAAGTGGGRGGAPRAARGGQTPPQQSRWVGGEDGTERLVFVDPRNPNNPAQPATNQDGTPVTRQRGSGQVAGPRATAEPRQSAAQIRERQARDAGFSEQDAAAIAAGILPAAGAVLAYRARRLGLEPTPEQRAAVDAEMDSLLPGWRQRLGGAAAVAPPPPAPAAPPRSGWSLPSWLGGSSAPRVAPQESPAPAAPIGQSGMQAEPPPAAGRQRIRVNENGERVF